MKSIINIICWIIVALFGVFAIVSLSEGGFFSAVIFLCGGFLVAPLSIVRKIKAKLKLNKALVIALVVVFFFVGVLTTPTSYTPDYTAGVTHTSQPTSGGETSPEPTATSADPTVTTPEPTASVEPTPTSPELTTSADPTETSPEPTKTTPPPTASHENKSSQTVYITETGGKYHSGKTCSGLSRAKAIYYCTLSQAVARGLTPCSKCH